VAHVHNVFRIAVNTDGKQIDLVREQPLETKTVLRFYPHIPAPEQKPILIFGDTHVSVAPQGRETARVSCTNKKVISCERLDVAGDSLLNLMPTYSADRTSCTVQLFTMSPNTNWHPILLTSCK